MSDKRTAQVLSVFAFLMDLFFRNVVGVSVSILAASVALYFFIKSLKVSKRIMGIMLPSEDWFVSCTCALMFGFSNFISKFMIPFFISSNDTITSASMLLISATVTYLAFRAIWIRSGHRDRYNQKPISQDKGKKEDVLQRTQNGLVILSVLSGLDGADLMLLIQLIVFFLSDIYGLINVITKNIILISKLLLQKLVRKRSITLREIVQHLAQDLKMIKIKNFEELFWNRAFYLIRYKRGLAFLVFSFVGSLPLIFFSWSIDLFNFKPNYLIGLTLLTIPSVAAFALVRMPMKIVPRDREKWRVRILIISLIPSLLAILIAAEHPKIIPLMSESTESIGIEQIRLKVGVAALLALFPVLLGLPIFFAINSSEVGRVADFVKWSKIAGFAPFFLMVCLMFVSNFYSSMGISAFLLFLYISFIVGASFYLFICYVTLSALYNFQARYNIDISSLVLRLFNPGPNLTTVVPSLVLGMSVFIVLEMPPFFHWRIEQILFVSLALSLLIGSLLQYPSFKGILGSLWISLFAIISYLLSLFFFAFSISLNYLIQIIVLWGHKIIAVPLIMIIIGNLISVIIIKYLKRKKHL